MGKVILPSAEDKASSEKLKIVIVGAHPDDPETACGGLITHYIRAGHEISVFYLTKGEAGISGKTHDEAAVIREEEARLACDALKVKPVFVGQIDGDTELSNSRHAEFINLLKDEKPDMVFSHWPIDSHRDHRVCSDLVYDAWLGMNKSFTFYYFEAITGHQTQHFSPSFYVDISDVMEEKRTACSFHVSQNVPRLLETHDFISKMRGRESNHEHAEAFIRHTHNS